MMVLISSPERHQPEISTWNCMMCVNSWVMTSSSHLRVPSLYTMKRFLNGSVMPPVPSPTSAMLDCSKSLGLAYKKNGRLSHLRFSRSFSESHVGGSVWISSALLTLTKAVSRISAASGTSGSVSG